MKYPLIKHLADVRKQKGITREAVADSIGYECETIMKIEYGERSPPLGKLMKWADCLGLEISLTPKVPHRVPEASHGSAEG